MTKGARSSGGASPLGGQVTIPGLSETTERHASTGSGPKAAESGKTTGPQDILAKSLSFHGLSEEAQHAQQGLEHDGNNASIVVDEIASSEMPWSPRSLVRAKSAIIYKVR
jgi:hypothetical protein